MDKRIKNKLINILMIIYKIFKSVFLIRNGNCKFIPSCSEYACDALNKLPFHKAILKIIIRIIKCNPFSKGGYDPIIENEERKKCE